MRSLALISLPTFSEEADSGSSIGSSSLNVSRPCSRSTVRGMSDDDNDLALSTLGSGDPWDTGRPSDVGTDSFDGSRGQPFNVHGVERPSPPLDILGFQYSTHDAEDDPIIQSMLGYMKSEAATVEKNLKGESMLLGDQDSRFDQYPTALEAKNIEAKPYSEFQDPKPAESSTLSSLPSATDMSEETLSGFDLPLPGYNDEVKNRLKPTKGKEKAESTTQQTKNLSTERQAEVGIKHVYSQSAFRRSKSIKSDYEINVNGPIEVIGSVKSGSSVTLTGDVIVREKVDAFGSLLLSGSIRCDGKVKAYGNITVNGYTLVNGKMKGCGKLRIIGTLETTDLEIYGNVSLTGHLKCRRLVVYGTLTLIGSDSSYYIEESEQVAGAVRMAEAEPDWDW
ncbi:uncharacterized protein FPRO_03865 [Fusarium proliferatum ET1]|uniref:Polymer-forming cytoskeletal protein n=1 Tax=Fusarium proliferatum (strain ET1) TaxID=1227346 RepID=A0A1L7W899_FUSPR|nr:uncharacterized protein FPRO_03865 [Fusarium proliferatum ET1]CZR48814.1 uncharacterized protein FPRO_03865 [Fusarium proliferatum ET1]